VPLDSEDDAIELRRRRAGVTNFSTWEDRLSKSQLPCLPCSSQRLLSLAYEYPTGIFDTVEAFLHTYVVVFEASLSSTLKDHPRTIMNRQT
jgi:hypothetical protein